MSTDESGTGDSAYELQRKENIRKNLEMLAALKLPQMKTDIVEEAAAAKRNVGVGLKRKRKPEISHEPVRRSTRLVNGSMFNQFD